MKHFTSTIPLDLAEKLQKKGMPLITSVSVSIVEDKPVVDENREQWYRPSYAEVFDWLMEREIYITIELSQIIADLHIASIHKKCRYDSAEQGTWHEAATKAIEKALELIK